MFDAFRAHGCKSTFLLCMLFMLVSGCGNEIVAPPPRPGPPQISIWDLDTYVGDGTVRVFWTNSVPDFPIFPPTPMPTVGHVELEMSTAGASTGFRLVAKSTTTGLDSTALDGLRNGVMHYFRMLSYDVEGRHIGTSRVLETIPGPVPTPEVVIPAQQREYRSRSLAWSPSGDRLAFVKSVNCVRSNLYAYHFASGWVAPLTIFASDEQYLSHPGWSADGSKIAFVYSPTRTAGDVDYRVWMIDVAGSLPRSVSSGRFDSEPAWVNEAGLVFVRYTNSPRAPEIQRLDLATSQVVPLTGDGRIWKQDLAVSKDGEWIAYTGTVHDPYSIPLESLYLVSTRGGASRSVGAGGFWEDIHPAWHPDGSRIFFASDRSGHFEIWSMALDATAPRQITRSQARFFVHCDPAISTDGSRLASLASNGSPTNIEVIPLAATLP